MADKKEKKHDRAPDDREYAFDNWVDYYHKLSKEEKLFIRRFHREFHGTVNSTKDFKVLTTEEDKKRAYRAINNRNRDVLDAGNRLDKISSYEERSSEGLYSEEEDWVQVYKYEGPEAAENFINDKFDRDLKNKYICKETTEIRRKITLEKLGVIDRRRGKYKCEKNRK